MRLNDDFAERIVDDDGLVDLVFREVALNPAFQNALQADLGDAQAGLDHQRAQLPYDHDDALDRVLDVLGVLPHHSGLSA